MSNGSTPQKRSFVQTWLPWLLGIVVFGLYSATANRDLPTVLDWTTMPMLQQPPVAASYSGYTFQTPIFAPVFYVVTWPLRLLSPAMIPAALSYFAALCGALALGQLARCVALLPHDRTRIQREHETSKNTLLSISLAWLPPVLATVIAMLNLSMWEQGTNGTVEMFDLLMFSYVVRSLIEFRLDQKLGRLYLATFLYGAAITNNVAMIAFLPLYIIALVWTRKLAFFNVKFLARMAGCGFAGLLFYLVLPTLGTLKGGHSFSFWELLTSNVVAQKWILFIFPRNTILLLSLTSVIPIFLMSIRWSSQFGDPSPIGVMITTAAFHLCHVVVLFACIWTSLDPDFSPRNVGYGLAFLPLYFLGALSIGYYSGYLLLISQPPLDRYRRPSGGAQAIKYGAAAVCIFFLIATPAMLWHRNFPQIRLSNQTLQSQLVGDLIKNLPPHGIILSDDSYRHFAVRSALDKSGRSKDYIQLCTQWLPAPEYHQYLKKMYPSWKTPEIDATQKIATPQTLATLIRDLGKDKPVTYLHPSFGYYFEYFDAQPNGLLINLVPSRTNSLVTPPQTHEQMAQNQKIWAEITDRLQQNLEPAILPPEISRKLPFPENIYERIGLRPIKNAIAYQHGIIYSRSLVNWAVELQRAGDYTDAVGHLKLAQRLNPKNIVAEINLAFNEKYRRGESFNVDLNQPLETFFGESRSWDQVLNRNGPYDTPALSYAQGYVFVQGNLIRQAAQAFERARQQATNDITSRLWLGQLNLNRNFPDQTLQMVSEIRQIAARIPTLATNLNDLFTLEAAAYLTKGQDSVAEEIIQTNIASRPDDFGILASACKAFADNRRYTNAFKINQKMLQLEPNNVACWINQGVFQNEMSDNLGAIESFTRVTQLETNNYRAILYRAMSYSRLQKWDQAKNDYETVQRQFPNELAVDYGLGEIAYHRKDTNNAIRYMESYVKRVSPEAAEAKLVQTRLAELRGEKPKPDTAPPNKPQ